MMFCLVFVPDHVPVYQANVQGGFEWQSPTGIPAPFAVSEHQCIGHRRRCENYTNHVQLKLVWLSVTPGWACGRFHKDLGLVLAQD